MKAWHVSNKYEPDYGSMIVFAETRGKAQAMAMSSELGEDSEWNDLWVVRAKAFDEYYTEGKREMEWDNDKDRIALVQHGWSCLEPDWDDCKYCPAQEFCDRYQDWLKEEAL